MAIITKKEKEFIKKVNDFLEKNNITLYVFSRAINYTNIEKLEAFFKYQSGTLTMNVCGRIEKFIEDYKPKE